MSRPSPGLYLTHKPVGETSFSLVRAFMQEIAAQPGRPLKVCHGGTLDPFAEGLLLLLVGQAVHLMDLHHPIPKTYEAQVVWGIETDTGDAGGRITFRGDPSILDPPRLDQELSAFVGWHDQVPPDTCAKKIGGEPAYRKAHRGEPVLLPPSRVYLHGAEWVSHELPYTSRLRITCRGGYYVRSLARDLGRRLGCGAHLARLHRTAIGPYADPGPAARTHLQGRELLPWFEGYDLTDAELGLLRRGEALPPEKLQPPDWALPPCFPEPPPLIRAFHRGRLAALLGEEPWGFKPVLLLRGGV